jgi:hypothetical protein
MRRLLLFWIACTLLAISVNAAPALQEEATAQGAPEITSFTTTATNVSRDALENRTARVPVSWATANRPVTANLVFEQVLPDNTLVNVELPRLLPWVLSSGNGMTAPILPSGNVNEIVLQVRLISLIDGRVYDQAQLTLPIVSGGGGSGSVGDRPTITSFTTPSTFVTADQLANGTARVPVSWSTANRPPTYNLRFEQVFADGSSQNVELPRENPIVASSGNGVTAPLEPPTGSANSITLRVSLYDLLTGRVHDLRDIILPVVPAGTTPTPTTAPAADIRSFTLDADSINVQELAGRNARIVVHWATENRPPNSNLVFEQVLNDGTVVNVELPRPNPIVPSSGDGLISPYPPGGNATEARFVLTLVGLDNGRVYDRVEATLPIVQPSTPTPTTYNMTFTTNVSSVDRQALANGTARVPVTWNVSPRPPNTNLSFEQVFPDGSSQNVELPRSNPIVPSSGNGVVAPVLPSGANVNQIVLRMSLRDLVNGSAPLAQRELILPITGTSNVTPQPRRFVLSTPNTEINGNQIAAGPVTNVISWDVSPRPPNSNLVFEQVFPNGVAVNAELPRPNPIVPSSGTGAVILRDPGVNVPEASVRVRLVNLGDGSTIDQQTLSIPISGRGASPAAGAATPEATQSAEPETTSCEFTWFVSGVEGCPADAAQQASVTTQEFENGTMLLFNTQVYFLSDQGTVVTGQSGSFDNVGEPPEGLFPPAPVFEAVWGANQELVGWATGPEGSYTATVQHSSEADPAGTEDVYITLPDGSIARLNGAPGNPTSWSVVE